MYAAQGLILRASIVLGMVAAVVTIIYLTPMPDQNFLSCDRPCHDLDWPMICRVTLTLENNYVPKKTHCHSKNCTIHDDDGKRLILAVNHELPGPAIQVCQNDVLIVDMVNKIPGHSMTIHWRGQPQNEAPMMDGVPMITQCPVSSYTTFQYRFRASSPGTHLWHAHSGSEISDGIFGALIVRQPHKIEPHRKFYDVDDKGHIMIISEWGPDLTTNLLPDYDSTMTNSLLINGKPSDDPATFKVISGKRYRFRVGYLGGSAGCPVTVFVNQHLLKVIALDGNPITPYEISAITISKGERVDFILKANQEIDRYMLKVISQCSDKVLDGVAVVKYENSFGGNAIKKIKKRFDVTNGIFDENIRKFDTGFCESKLGQVCVLDAHSLVKIPYQISDSKVDKVIHLSFAYNNLTPATDSEQPRKKVYTMNNILFTYPPSPLLTQKEDVPREDICNSQQKPKQCHKSKICECVHVEQIPLGSSVELMFVDQGGDANETVFHLHGYHFYVVGYRNFDKPVSLDIVKKLDKEGNLMKRILANPVMKDTIRVPKYGIVAVRFIANNPGYWMIRDEQAKQWSRGMDVVLQVGHSCDMLSKPTNFPSCGSWIGPDFFLI